MQETIESTDYLMHCAGRLPIVLVNYRHANSSSFIDVYMLKVAWEGYFWRFLRIAKWNRDCYGNHCAFIKRSLPSR